MRQPKGIEKKALRKTSESSVKKASVFEHRNDKRLKNEFRSEIWFMPRTTTRVRV